MAAASVPARLSPAQREVVYKGQKIRLVTVRSSLREIGGDKNLPGNMTCEIDVHPRIKSPSSPLVWLATYTMPCITMPIDKTNGNISDVSIILNRDELVEC